MKIIPLVENTTISLSLKTKHGLCIYIETKKHKILFDLGPNDLFLRNASKIGVNIADIDTVIISHGHYDHGGGLETFMQNNDKAKIYIHNMAFGDYYSKRLGVKKYIGLDKTLKDNNRIIFTKDNFKIDDELQLFSDITNHTLCSEGNSSLYEKSCEDFTVDSFQHEQSLIIYEGNKNVLFAGCAHNGIVNILEKAENICGKELDYVISGFHLSNPATLSTEKPELIEAIGKELKRRSTNYYTCHCTGKKPFETLQSILGNQIKYLALGCNFEI